MSAKQVLLLVAAAVAGSIIGSGAVWRASTVEHARLMNLEKNRPLIESFSDAETGENVTLDSITFSASVDKCVNNAGDLARINRFPTSNIERIGWKDYIRGGVIVYVAGSEVGSEKLNSAFACIISGDGDLEDTWLVRPQLPGNPAVSKGAASFLQVSF